MTKKHLVLLSGGLDSTVVLKYIDNKFDASEIQALSFDYGQIQDMELFYAAHACRALNIEHEIVELPFLAHMGKNFSANLSRDVYMPTLHEVKNSKRPNTYVPNRNMIMLSIAAAYAEVHGISKIWTGIRETSSYYDTTAKFITRMNNVLELNWAHNVQIFSVLLHWDKVTTLGLLKSIDGNLDFAKYSFSCYRPIGPRPCGTCPACESRLAAFKTMGERDPLEYAHT